MAAAIRYLLVGALVVVAAGGAWGWRQVSARLDAAEKRIGADEQWMAHAAILPPDAPEWMRGQWWCYTGGCFRTRPDCDAASAQSAARSQYNAKLAKREDCALQRIAWCGPHGCQQEYSMCLAIEAKDSVCMGVE